MIKRILFAAVSLAAAAAHADDPGFTFECDTPAGHYSSWSAPTTATALTITGTLRVNEMRTEKRWSTVAAVMIRGGADGKTSYGFRAYDFDKKNKALHLELLKVGGHDDFGDDSIKVGKKPVPFRLVLTSTGTLRANIGGAQHAVELGSFAPKKIVVSCSTGDFTLGDIRIEENKQ